MKFHELACSFMSLHAVTWACMHLHELACSSMTLHSVTQACMQFLSLSEQLTRISQCLFCCRCKLQQSANFHSIFASCLPTKTTTTFERQAASIVCPEKVPPSLSSKAKEVSLSPYPSLVHPKLPTETTTIESEHSKPWKSAPLSLEQSDRSFLLSIPLTVAP